MRKGENMLERVGGEFAFFRQDVARGECAHQIICREAQGGAMHFNY